MVSLIETRNASNCGTPERVTDTPARTRSVIKEIAESVGSLKMPQVAYLRGARAVASNLKKRGIAYGVAPFNEIRRFHNRLGRAAWRR
jgi:hypothetical protein